MSLDRRTHYVTARDGTRIAYHTHVPRAPDEPTADELRRRPALVLTNGIGTPEHFWKHLVHALGRDHRVVHWDYRGHGQSGRSVSGAYAMEVQADDLARVTAAVIAEGDGTTPPVHVGFSMGVTVVLELVRARPEFVPAMVLLSGPADAPFSTLLPFRLPGVMPALRFGMKALRPVVRAVGPTIHRMAGMPFAYPVARAIGVLRPRTPRDDVELFTQSFASMDPTVFWDTLCGLMNAHASDVLPTVRIPVLVIGASDDLMVPPSQFEALHRGLRTPHRTVMEDTSHALLLEAGPEVAAEIRLFLRTTLSRAGVTQEPAVAR